MSDEKTMPQLETEAANRGAQRARYAAYVQCARKLARKAKADRAAGKRGGDA